MTDHVDNQGKATRPPRPAIPGTKSHVSTKIYVVKIWNNLAKEGQANTRILALRLTKTAAEAIRDSIAGSWIERYNATKSHLPDQDRNNRHTTNRETPSKATGDTHGN